NKTGNKTSIKKLLSFLFGLLKFILGYQKLKSACPKDVTLTCRAPDNKDPHVQWSRADLKEDKLVFVYRNKMPDPENQHPSFKNRVDLQDRQMKDGDVSLILKNVTTNDTGTYNCRVQRETESMKLINTNRRKRANQGGDLIKNKSTFYINPFINFWRKALMTYSLNLYLTCHLFYVQWSLAIMRFTCCCLVVLQIFFGVILHAVFFFVFVFFTVHCVLRSD
uniref:Ig-like domain-containing protein n=1 Tax=Oreochromis aureus TaxID=47969 RepID=A0AAZ1XNF0_OREAU